MNKKEVKIEDKIITYEGVGRGFRGYIVAHVEMTNDKISRIDIVRHREDMGWYNPAKMGVLSSILKDQTTNVDIVAAATYSSRGIIDAVKNAIKGKKEVNNKK